MNEAKAAIAASYDRSAEDFAQFADKLVYSHLAAPLADVLSGVDGRVLDVAGGTGALARLLKNPVATDISIRQLLHNPLEEKVVADAERLPFRADAFAAAACAFGVNHFPDVDTAIGEMARVAPVVGIVTWARPDEAFAPKEIVLELVERHAGRSRTTAGDLVEEMTNAMGSVPAIAQVLERAGLDPDVRQAVVGVPWPGVEAFVDYRMSMTGVVPLIDDPADVRAEGIERINALPREDLDWTPTLIVATGRR